MAKLHFYYSTMNAGKSTTLLQSDYNYRERGMNTLLLAPKFDDRFGVGKISSRIGLSAEATLYDDKTNLKHVIERELAKRAIHCVLVDESQFLTKKQVLELSDVVDYLNIPVLAYGLRNDFQSEPFEGSKYLLTWADQLIEIKTICHCGKKATHVVRVDEKGEVIKSGEQLEIGGNDRYVAVCRKHFKEAVI
ncbi:thymidine kinase [Fangia hongkongensis]|uniref:thymidine kinase n=1 Tax=Fangia hongkongensis TaxID=270495 RepID=UPI0003792B1B|nr:thymidine kinase [Fangia hongkongensis]MBK2126144.1 thymidine kinase [Fangia hongkongensis]